MQVNEHPIAQEELMAYLDGELSADRASLAREHVEHCVDCQRVTADLRTVSMRIAVWQVEKTSEQLPMRLASALAERGPARRAGFGRGFRPWRPHA